MWGKSTHGGTEGRRTRSEWKEPLTETRRDGEHGVNRKNLSRRHGGTENTEEEDTRRRVGGKWVSKELMRENVEAAVLAADSSGLSTMTMEAITKEVQAVRQNAKKSFLTQM